MIWEWGEGEKKKNLLSFTSFFIIRPHVPYADTPKENRKPRNSTEDRSPPVAQSIIIVPWAYRKSFRKVPQKIGQHIAISLSKK